MACFLAFSPSLRRLGALIALATSTMTAHAVQDADEQAPRSPRDTTTLATVEVVGETAVRTTYGRQTAAAKTALPVRELPQSVRIITQQTIEDLGARQLDMVLDYASGVSRNNNLGDLRDGVMIRGLPTGVGNFGADMLFNGFSSSRGYPVPRDLAGVERIEFLKGPAAALYGSSSPGGTLNLVSKRPLWQAAHTASLTFGRHDLKRIAVDSSAPLSQNIAYRMNLAFEEGGSFRDHVNPQRRVLAPALTWKLGEGTVLEYVGELIYHKTPMDRGVVAMDGQLGIIPRERFLGEPGEGNLDLNNKTHQLILTHPLSGQWNARVAASSRTTKLFGFATAARATPSITLRPNGDLNRRREWLDWRSKDANVQAEVQGSFHTASIAHDLLIGAEGSQYDEDYYLLLSDPADAYILNIFDPVYGLGFPPVSLMIRDSSERQYSSGLYLQDAIKLAPNWRLVAGVRVDRYRQRRVSNGDGATTWQRASARSPRLGISWLPSSQWTVYASGGKSFLPNGGQDAAGNSFKPEIGLSLESGVKWENVQRTLGMTLAAFNIKKRNILTPDPDNAGFSITTGEVRSRGLEWDLSGQAGEHWRLNASLAYTRADVRKDNTLAVGARINNSPRVTGSALAIYESSLGNGQRWSIGGGLVHVGDRLGQTRTQADLGAGRAALYLPAYTTVKLVASWQPNDALHLRLNVDNLFDRSYYASSFNSVWIRPGASRMVSLEAQVSF